MKFFIGLIVLAAAVYFGARQGYLKGELFGRLLGLGPSEADKALAQVVQNTNARLPRMVTSDISFDRVTASREEVILHYRFVDLDQSAVMQKYAIALQQLQNAVIDDVCSDKAVRQYVFGGGYSAQVMLRAQDTRTILNTYVRAERCR
jgi:hypothetical protein